jgi:hypothetical protein
MSSVPAVNMPARTATTKVNSVPYYAFMPGGIKLAEVFHEDKKSIEVPWHNIIISISPIFIQS